jgi:hypothetical protein
VETPSFDGFKGALAENYVCAALTASGYVPFYWESQGKAEVDFVIQDRDGKSFRWKSRRPVTSKQRVCPSLSVGIGRVIQSGFPPRTSVLRTELNQCRYTRCLVYREVPGGEFDDRSPKLNKYFV